ncbi:hypothetical protein EYF80_061799 [Liparis tanakae]|uniref:Uncharacterized protein n=1 Tax=Liparis tanakae TaxID=230148 RepID=A0A4Z2EHU8_9TELE|nr:hypothetical protein EYF80_061799 [Liparis tanakae]
MLGPARYFRLRNRKYFNLLSGNDALGAGADGAELLVALEYGEGGVSNLHAVELALCLTHPDERSGQPAVWRGSTEHTQRGRDTD